MNREEDVCEFAIPELPRGRRLTLNIRSTWGDRYYVGLTGIEIFSETGRPVKPIKVCKHPSLILKAHTKTTVLYSKSFKHLLAKTKRSSCFMGQISADPADINVLPEYGSDPRVVGNLIDGVNRTCDDTHMWLAPFTAGRSHLVLLEFDRDYSIALLRIWVRATRASTFARYSFQYLNSFLLESSICIL